MHGGRQTGARIAALVLRCKAAGKIGGFGAGFGAVGLHCGQLIFIDHFGVVQKPADKGTFAVVDIAADPTADYKREINKQKIFNLYGIKI